MMLKVVGASWEQTRVTSLLLLAVTVVGIFAIFFYEAPPIVYDGNYAATINWGPETGFRIDYWGQNNDPQSIKKGLARAYYRPDYSQNGWAAIEIETQETYPDWMQAYGAGMLEGSLCWQLIYWHWQNTVQNACRGREEFCTKARKALEENEAAVRQMAKTESRNPYWHQVDLYYHQLEGMYEGWKIGVQRSRKDVKELSKTDFLWMNHMSDLKDLEDMNNASRSLDPSKATVSLALLKYLPSDKFFLAHQSAGYYSQMLRIQKRYIFRYHYKNELRSPLVSGQSLLFTSYPASIHSQDDFYQINGTSKMTVAGTVIKNFNRDLWKNVDFGEIFMGPRVLAANRLAQSAKKWRSFLSMHNSGTGCKQWLVVDNAKPDVKLWVVDQVTGATVAKDVTNEWKRLGYWFNYGVPNFKETHDLAGYDSELPAVQHLKRVFDELTPVIANLTSVNDILELATSTQYALLGRGDIAALVDNCNSSVTEKIVQLPIRGSNILQHHVRGDDTSNSTDDDDDDDDDDEEFVKEYEGLIDLKISTGSETFLAAAGPPSSKTTAPIIYPFQWSKSLLDRAIPHFGQMDLWDFPDVQLTWSW